MKILVIGGTKFLGKHFVQAALDAGHELTLFNRGETNPGLFTRVKHIQGNRDGDLAKLGDGPWDTVIDTCGYVPRLLGDSAAYLADRAGHYLFVSTISVYKDFREHDQDEDSALGTLDDETVEEITGETYGPLKALCERAAEEAMPGRVLHVRPGLIVGPNDPTNRFTYWVTRLARGGETLAPLPQDAPVQVIDVRDLSEWMLRMVERKATGVYNATGPDRPVPMKECLETIRSAVGGDGSLTWVTPEFLQEQEVAPWMELPLWLPGEEYGGLCVTNIQRAKAEGLTFRPLADTALDTLAWTRSLEKPPGGDAGLKREREAELLRKWKAAQA